MTQENFQARLERIGVDQPAQAPIEYRQRTVSSAEPGVLLELFMVPLAFISGLGSVIFAFWVQFHYLTDQGEFGMSGGGMAGGFMGDIIIAVVVSLGLKEILNLKSPARSWSEIIGFVLGLFGLHHLVALMPGVFAELFSAQWVLYSVL